MFDISGSQLNNNSKNSEALAKNNNAVSTLKKEVDIYAMPTKFLPSGPRPKAKRGFKIIIFTGILVLVLGSLVAGAIWYLSVNVQPAADTNSVVSENDNNQNNNNPTPNTNSSNNTNSIATNDMPVNDNNPDVENTNDVVETEENLDTDGDGLTIDEEILFLTNTTKNDSDRDGYSDGQEIVSLYNPLVPGQSLENSGLVSRYRNLNFKYSILIPKAWLPSPANSEASEVVLLSNSENGEFITIQASKNGDNQKLETLALSYFPANEITENYSVAGQAALRSQNRVLFVSADMIYVVDHQSSPLNQIRFSAVYDMILKSWQFIKEEVELEP